MSNIDTTTAHDQVSTLRVLNQRVLAENLRLHSGSAKKNKQTPRKPWLKDSSYLWSLEDDNPHMTGINGFLSKVKEGILKVANELNFPIHIDDCDWLDQHSGRFKLYMAPGSDQGKSFVKRKIHANMTMQEVSARGERDLHFVLQDSPRISKDGNTNHNYDRWLKNLWNFLAMIGDYQSMIILLDKPPRGDICPSLNCDSLIYFCYHKFKKRKEPLTSTAKGGHPVLDINNARILCEGSLQSVKWSHSLFAAISAIHKRQEKDDQYKSPCDNCMASPQNGTCQKHRGQYWWRYTQGNPTRSGRFKDLKDWMKRESLNRGYSPDHRSAFLPHDITTMHEILRKSKYDIYNLQNYCVVLDAIHTGCRFDSYSEIRTETFTVTGCFWVIKNGRIISFAQRVREKSDTTDHNYRIPFDDCIPQRCLARHLLIFFHCINVSEGYIFLEKNHLLELFQKAKGSTSLPSKGEYSLDYNQFSKWIVFVAQKMDAHNLANFGPHSPRSTKYLFDFLGGAHFADSAVTTRHKTMEMAQLYFGDSRGMQNFMAEHEELLLLHRVSPFRDNLIRGSGSNNLRLASQINGLNSELDSLSSLSKLFVEQMLHVNSDHEFYRCPAFLLERSYSYKFNPATTSHTNGVTQEELHLQAIHSLPNQYRNQLLASWHLYRRTLEPISSMNNQISEVVLQNHNSSLVVNSGTLSTQNNTGNLPPTPRLPSTPRRPHERVAILTPTPPSKPHNSLPSQFIISPVRGQFVTDATMTTFLTIRVYDGIASGFINIQNKKRLTTGSSYEQKILNICQLAQEIADLPRNINCRALPIMDRLKSGYELTKNHKDKEDTNRLKQLFNKSIFPIAKCFYVCHRADKDSFMGMHNVAPKPAPSHFTKSRCQVCLTDSLGKRKRDNNE